MPIWIPNASRPTIILACTRPLQTTKWQGYACFLLHLKNQHLIRERQGSAAQRTTWKIGCRTDGGGTKSLSGTGQFRQAYPRIRFRIVALVLVKILTTAEPSVWIALLALTADEEQQPMVINCRPAASGGRHWRCFCPLVRRGIIDVVVMEVVDLTSGASTDDVDFAIDDRDTHMITCQRHRRFFSPLIGRWVVDFVDVEWRWVARPAAEDVNFSA